MELKKLKEQYGDSIQKCARLEEELERYQKRVKILENIHNTKRGESNIELESELINVRGQLAHKTQLLDKVKILLQKAASKEKALQDQVSAFACFSSIDCMDNTLVCMNWLLHNSC